MVVSARSAFGPKKSNQSVKPMVLRNTEYTLQLGPAHLNRLTSPRNPFSTNMHGCLCFIKRCCHLCLRQLIHNMIFQRETLIQKRKHCSPTPNYQILTPLTM